MADQPSVSDQTQVSARPSTTNPAEYPPNTTARFTGFLAFLVSRAILLLLTGLTVTATVLALIFLAPLLLISSPIWVPVAAVLLVTVAGFLSVSRLAVVAAAALTWVCRYYRGLHPPGSNRVDYARSRIANTATHVKDYARQYGGYLRSEVKDAAPGA